MPVHPSNSSQGAVTGAEGGSPESTAHRDVAGLPMAWPVSLAQSVHAAGVELVTYVPDARLKPGITALQAQGTVVRGLTSEEECVGYAGGYAAAGGRASVWMQCSGLGNCLNALGSFVIPCRLGLPLVISMRGTLGEGNPSQVPMGRAATALLEALGVQSFGAQTDEEVCRVAPGVLRLAIETGTPAALILHPTLGGGRERG